MSQSTPSLYRHEEELHSPRNVNILHDTSLTFGQRVADIVASTMGSWRFIIIQSCILLAWLVLNITGLILRWDPYPFILLNLMLSFEAAYAAPIIMMSQNRQTEKDRIVADETHAAALKEVEKTMAVIAHLSEQDKELLTQTAELLRQTADLARIKQELFDHKAIMMQFLTRVEKLSGAGKFLDIPTLVTPPADPPLTGTMTTKKMKVSVKAKKAGQ